MEKRIDMIRPLHLQGGEAARTRARNGALMHRVIGYALHRRDKAREEGEGKKYWQGVATVLCWLKARGFLFGDLVMEAEAKRTALLHRIRRYVRRRDQRAETVKETR
jgi:hypothetical protein